MRAPYSWLTEVAPTKLSPEKLAHALTMAGSEVTGLERVDGDTVFELEITPNRADCLSIIGLAREIAAITGSTLRLPRVKGQGSRVKGRQVKIRILDRNGCAQYLGRLITGVTVKPSPEWMQRRLLACGIRPINNVVDITNYVLLEWGQPLHAFDWATLRAGMILVRRAQPGERLRTLDEVDRTLNAATLVIADAERPVAIAGIMGGTATAVTVQTRDLLLESAQFDLRTVRLMARQLGVQSESSYRFERGVDPAGVELASRRAAQLLRELADGVEVTCVHAGQRAQRPRAIAVRPDELVHRLGISFARPRAQRMLQTLGCRVRTTGKRWHVTAPTHRPDLAQPVDLVEELARLTGYERIPSTLPTIAINARVPASDPLREVREVVRSHVIGCGLQEAVTWSLVPATLLAWSGTEAARAVRITNPLSQEQAFLRPALWPRLVQAVATNLHRQCPGAALFEIGNAYMKTSAGAVCAELRVAVAMSGTWSHHWDTGAVAADVFALKGILESLAERLRISDVEFRPSAQAGCESRQSAEWLMHDTHLGMLGALSAQLRAAIDVRQSVVIAEASIELLATHAASTARYVPVPKTPVVTRDISLIVSTQHAHAAIVRAIHAAGGPHLESVTLIDRYSRPSVPSGHVSLTYTLQFRDPARTLTDADVNQLQAAIVQAVTREFGAALRA